MTASNCYHAALKQGIPPDFIVGVDEVGRGPLAGPVVTAAVILDPDKPIEGLRDSKKLSARQRETLNTVIRERALAISLGRAEVAEIDQLNIREATLLAMQRAVAGLCTEYRLILVDGNVAPTFSCPAIAVIRGDDKIDCIRAASILAKVSRDDEMTRLSRRCPEYGFERHKGYGTPQHLLALRQLGPTVHHRSSFQPVKSLLADLLAEKRQGK